MARKIKWKVLKIWLESSLENISLHKTLIGKEHQNNFIVIIFLSPYILLHFSSRRLRSQPEVLNYKNKFHKYHQVERLEALSSLRLISQLCKKWKKKLFKSICPPTHTLAWFFFGCHHLAPRTAMRFKWNMIFVILSSRRCDTKSLLERWILIIMYIHI